MPSWCLSMVEMGLTTLWGVARLGTIKIRSRLQTSGFCFFVLIVLKKKKAEKIKMSLTDVDKSLVKAFWEKVSERADAVGHEALVR